MTLQSATKGAEFTITDAFVSYFGRGFCTSIFIRGAVNNDGHNCGLIQRNNVFSLVGGFFSVPHPSNYRFGHIYISCIADLWLESLTPLICESPTRVQRVLMTCTQPYPPSFPLTPSKCVTKHKIHLTLKKMLCTTHFLQVCVMKTAVSKCILCADHGVCNCGKCFCDEDWFGESCQYQEVCSLSNKASKDLCRNAQGVVCSNAGKMFYIYDIRKTPTDRNIDHICANFFSP